MSTDQAALRYRSLQRRARRDGRATDELLTLYAQEGFLRRLQASRHADAFVLKGGVLMAARGVRRPTRDIDMQGDGFDVDEPTMEALVAEVAAIDVDDGLTYDTATITTTTIRDDDEYNGVRVKVAATLATGRMTLKLDISTGDPIQPAAEPVEIPSLVEGQEPIRMAGFPVEAVLAEKLVTALQRGTANTRWRDFADVHTLVATQPVDQATLAGSVRAVAAHRGQPLAPLAAVLDGYAAANQDRWAAWVRKHDMVEVLPASFATAVDTAIEVFDAAIATLDPT